jgi:AmmeMemoRadiSam system protein A
LSDIDKEVLLRLARKSIQFFFKNRRIPKASDLGESLSGELKKPRAAFVTLNLDGNLRGCIGDILPRVPLNQSVINNAINAAFNDSRFRPLSESEYDDITLSISALTIPKKIDSYEQIRIGIDGVILRKSGHSAVFLPQVAPEQGWDVAETLTHLSMKAGLPPDAWKKGAQFETFQAEVFGKE